MSFLFLRRFFGVAFFCTSCLMRILLVGVAVSWIAARRSERQGPDVGRSSCVRVQWDAWQEADWVLLGCASSRDSTYPPVV
jgi:hypothetical protein